MRIIIKPTQENAELVELFRKAYHKAHGTKGFADPDLVFK